jgi:hypothetical protein
MPQPSIPIAITLAPAHRTPAGVNAAGKLLQGLRVQVSGAGSATISARVDPGVFKELFGIDPPFVGAKAASERDFGTPAGYSWDADLPVPPALAGVAERISVQAPATRV